MTMGAALADARDATSEPEVFFFLFLINFTYKKTILKDFLFQPLARQVTGERDVLIFNLGRGTFNDSFRTIEEGFSK